jgi:hypothetical protein
MAKETVEPSKYGRNNFHLKMDGTDIVIRIDASSMALNKDGTPKLAGTPNPTPKDPDKIRSVDLIGTSLGFKGVGDLQVSCNVTST